MLGWKRASALRSCLCIPPRKLTPTTQLSPARALHPSAHAKLEEPILNLRPRAEQLTETFISTQADLPQAPASPAPNSSSTPKETLYSILIILAALAGIFARWWALSKTSLWWDEGYSLWISQFSLKEIWRGVAADTSPPLYYFLLHGWIHLFGRSEFALRSMSALFETLSIPIFYLIARRVLQDKLAIAAAMWLYALSAFQAQYARDARFYAVLCFFALAAVYSLIEFMEMRSYVYFAALILCLDAGLYIHNMMLFYLLGIAVLWLVYPAKPNLRRRVLDGLLCALAVFFSFPALASQPAPSTKVCSAILLGSPSIVSRSSPNHQHDLRLGQRIPVQVRFTSHPFESLSRAGILPRGLPTSSCTLRLCRHRASDTSQPPQITGVTRVRSDSTIARFLLQPDHPACIPRSYLHPVLGNSSANPGSVFHASVRQT